MRNNVFIASITAAAILMYRHHYLCLNIMFSLREYKQNQIKKTWSESRPIRNFKYTFCHLKMARSQLWKTRRKKKHDEKNSVYTKFPSSDMLAMNMWATVPHNDTIGTVDCALWSIHNIVLLCNMYCQIFDRTSRASPSSRYCSTHYYYCTMLCAPGSPGQAEGDTRCLISGTDCSSE